MRQGEEKQGQMEEGTRKSMKHGCVEIRFRRSKRSKSKETSSSQHRPPPPAFYNHLRSFIKDNKTQAWDLPQTNCIRISGEEAWAFKKDFPRGICKQPGLAQREGSGGRCTIDQSLQRPGGSSGSRSHVEDF